MNTNFLSFCKTLYQVVKYPTEVVVVVIPGLQTDDYQADAITTAYLNINMVEVECTCGGHRRSERGAPGGPPPPN